jgi:hypothetical protein
VRAIFFGDYFVCTFHAGRCDPDAIADACLDTTSIISDAQNKLTTAARDFSFNILSVRVVERIS